MGQLVHNLRGRAAPPDELIVRLEALSDKFRLTWTPAAWTTKQWIWKGQLVPKGRPVASARWWLWELRPTMPGDWVRREAGKARIARVCARPIALQDLRPFDLWQAEATADGLYPVFYWPDEEFYTEHAFDRLLAGHQAALEADRHIELEAIKAHQTGEDVVDEMNQNPAFAAFVRDVAKDFYFHVSGGALIALPAGGLRHDDADRERVHGPGHGEAGQPAQHPVEHGGAGAGDGQEVRAGGAGPAERGDAGSDGDASAGERAGPEPASGAAGD